MILDLLVDKQGQPHVCEIQGFDCSGLSGLDRVTQSRSKERLEAALTQRVVHIDQEWRERSVNSTNLEFLQRCFDDKSHASILMDELRISNDSGAEDVFLIDGQDPSELLRDIIRTVGLQKAYVIKKPWACQGEGVFIVPATAIKDLLSVLQFASSVTGALNRFGQTVWDLEDEHTAHFLKVFRTINPDLYRVFKRLEKEGYIDSHQLAGWTKHREKEVSPYHETTWSSRTWYQPRAIVVQPFCDDVEAVSVRECFNRAGRADRLEDLQRRGLDKEPAYPADVDLSAKRKPTTRLVVEVHLRDGAVTALMPVAAYEKMTLGVAHSFSRRDNISKAEISAPVADERMHSIFDALRARLEKSLSRMIKAEENPAGPVLSLLCSAGVVKAVLAMDIMEYYLLNPHYHQADIFVRRAPDFIAAIVKKYPQFRVAQKEYATKVLATLLRKSTSALPRNAAVAREVFPVILGMVSSQSAPERKVGLTLLQDLTVNHDVYDIKLTGEQIRIAFDCAKPYLGSEDTEMANLSRSIACRCIDDNEAAEALVTDENLQLLLPYVREFLDGAPYQSRPGLHILEEILTRGLATAEDLDRRYPSKKGEGADEYIDKDMYEGRFLGIKEPGTVKEDPGPGGKSVCCIMQARRAAQHIQRGM